ncbi:MAG: adenosylcobalamin-dependent ribonucleoside-diphosphate reductase [Alphaproteobacteria bacterium]|nr:adenosylcobalamin-dependent ribonucleoside-diphosphate reductase [Alphaproteobacteria bacterium]
MVSVAPISQQIWDMKYRLRGPDGFPIDQTIEDTWRRVARALAAPEKNAAAAAQTFYEAMADFRFLPAGRIVAGAGSGRDVTLFNCFVMGTIPDDMAGIFQALKEAALTMQQGGGIGYDFSTLRPKGAPVKGVGADASGPLSFMNVWDAMCRTIMSAGYRRGAMMATLRCDHPDIEAFIDAKREPGQLRMFNLSVLVTDAFMTAVKNDAPWELTFGGTLYSTVQARDLWEKIMRATYAYAEPGAIFIDRINGLNNLYYAETIAATNPCGEQPLPPYGNCLLGSINLARLVQRPFEDDAALDEAQLARITATAVRMLDNAIDVSRYPLPEQEHEAKAKRRIGLGLTGLADALILCGVRYDSDKGRALASQWMGAISRNAYLTSTQLAKEKGAFPLYDAEKYLAGANVRAMDADVQAAIRKHGIRNALLTSVAPTGTISLLADNVSSGLEPVFSFSYERSVLMPDGSRRQEEVTDYAYRLFRTIRGEHMALPKAFLSAQALIPSDHVKMQAAIQEHIDSAVSKTINVATDTSFEAFQSVYLQAYESGCKGCTTFRPNEITGSVLSVPEKDKKRPKAEPELPLEAPKSRPKDSLEAGAVVYMTRPLDRPNALPGNTYKVSWPEHDHAFYITINDIVQDGRRRPFEVFINSKNLEHYAWTVALTRMISAVFRRGGDVAFVAEELKAVFDPRGGQWVGGHYVPSLLAAIGEVIEQHLIQIGFTQLPKEPQEEVTAVRLVAGAESATPRQRSCPKCSMPSLICQEGCDTCTSCGYSKCS